LNIGTCGTLRLLVDSRMKISCPLEKCFRRAGHAGHQFVRLQYLRRAGHAGHQFVRLQYLRRAGHAGHSLIICFLYTETNFLALNSVVFGNSRFWMISLVITKETSPFMQSSRAGVLDGFEKNSNDAY
jgi:hypothetical protein